MVTKREGLVIAVMASFVVVLLSEGCGGRSYCNGTLTAPTAPTNTISGTVTTYRAGPASDAVVWVYPAFASPSEGICDGTPSSHTDQQGHYSWSGKFSTASLAVGKTGYQTAWKNNVSPPNPTANFVLHPDITVVPNEATFHGTIAGDEFIAGDDILFGGLCAHTPCVIVNLNGNATLSRAAITRAEVRLQWSDPSRQLALYVSHVGNLEDPPFTVGTTTERACCASELVGRADLGKYFPDVVAVAFEHAGSGAPGPLDMQSFELTVVAASDR